MSSKANNTSRRRRIVLVTGGRGRIGSAIAASCQARGDLVLVLDRTPLPRKKQPDGIVHYRADLANESQTRTLFRTIQRKHGVIQAAVLAAGDFVFGPFRSHTARDWERMFRNNVLTAFLCLQELAQAMTKGGHVVLLGSIVDHRVVRGNAVYGASKAALRMLGDVVREETRGSPLRITNLCLGAVASPMARQLAKGTTIQSTLDPAIVVDTVSWLLDSPLEPRVDQIRLFPPVGVNDI